MNSAVKIIHGMHFLNYFEESVMKRKLILAIACCMVLGLGGCSSENSTESEAQSGLQVEEIPAAEIIPANFNSAEALLKMVKRLQEE